MGGSITIETAQNATRTCPSRPLHIRVMKLHSGAGEPFYLLQTRRRCEGIRFREETLLFERGNLFLPEILEFFDSFSCNHQQENIIHEMGISSAMGIGRRFVVKLAFASICAWHYSFLRLVMDPFVGLH